MEKAFLCHAVILFHHIFSPFFQECNPKFNNLAHLTRTWGSLGQATYSNIPTKKNYMILVKLTSILHDHWGQVWPEDWAWWLKLDNTLTGGPPAITNVNHGRCWSWIKWRPCWLLVIADRSEHIFTKTILLMFVCLCLSRYNPSLVHSMITKFGPEVQKTLIKVTTLLLRG